MCCPTMCCNSRFVLHICFHDKVCARCGPYTCAPCLPSCPCRVTTHVHYVIRICHACSLCSCMSSFQLSHLNSSSNIWLCNTVMCVYGCVLCGVLCQCGRGRIAPGVYEHITVATCICDHIYIYISDVWSDDVWAVVTIMHRVVRAMWYTGRNTLSQLCLRIT